MGMATFDFIESSSKGYKFFWDERRLIARLALIPALLKFSCLILIEVLGISENFLRQGLVLLPAYFAEGWILAYLVRLFLYHQGVKKNIEVHNRTIAAGMGVYVLIQLTQAFIFGYIAANAPEQPVPPPPPSLEMFLVAMIFLAVVIWAFRLLWLYIPVAMDYNLVDFMRKIRGYTSSVYIIGTWLICYLPPLMILIVCTELWAYAFPGNFENPDAPYKFVMRGLQVIVELSIGVIITIALANGFREVMDKTGDRSRRSDS